MGRVRAFLIVVILLVTPAPAQAGRSGLEWKPCADDGTAQCAVLRVPVDWSEPYGPKIGMAVARRTASDPARRVGTLVVNPGGPGGSGVDFAIGAAGFFSAELRSRFDIVGFDPRGVARSAPVLCTESLVQEQPSPLLTSPAQYDAALAYNRALAADCREHTGPVFGHVDSLSVARDVDALRAAIGETTISFYGASYGTLFGELYAERYPRRVRAVVLDSVMDHSVGTEEFLGAETDTAQDAFDEFVAWCARDALCVLRGRDLHAMWATLIGRAVTGTLRDPYDPGKKLTVFELVKVAFVSFYAPQWYSLAHYLKEAEEASAPAGRRVPEALVEFSFPAVFCADWSLPMNGYADLAAQLAELAQRAPQMTASPLALTATVGCLGWPSPVTNPQRPLAATGTPTLLINARHDPATPYLWARNVTAQLGPKATLLTYDGWGHVVYGRTACVTSAVDRYLIDLRLPAPGISCPGTVPDPFGIG
jgi:pimeloyl-ACP methyl ester carboxylesterase